MIDKVFMWCVIVLIGAMIGAIAFLMWLSLHPEVLGPPPL